MELKLDRKITLKSQQEFGKIGVTNGKMPGTAYAISPSKCHVGSKLADVLGSTCHKCYALRIEQFRESARKGWSANLDKAAHWIETAPDAWSDAMAFQIRWQLQKLGENVHRWFDAGDLQSIKMLRAIVRVCELTPEIRHWLPTREAAIVKAWRAEGGIEPANLVIRISATMVGDKPLNYPNTSTVHRKDQQAFGHACPASSPKHRALNDGNSFCGPCRACWDKSVPNVSYPLH